MPTSNTQSPIIWDFTAPTHLLTSLTALITSAPSPPPHKAPNATSTHAARVGQSGAHGRNGMGGATGASARERELWVAQDRDAALHKVMQRCVTPQGDEAVSPSHRTHSIVLNDKAVTLLKGAHLLIRNNGANGMDGESGLDGSSGGEGGDAWLRHRVHLEERYRDGHLDMQSDYVAAGEGGDGGNGGHGGNGGNGGDSANVILSTADARLFRLLKTETRAGRGGAAGRGGRGGDGGRGGLYPKYYKDSHAELRAPSGRRGMDGQNGMAGRDGNNVGKTIYRVYADETKSRLVEEGVSPFDVKIDGFTVRALNNDGVIEPGEELVLENITLRNTGDISLPEGCRLSLLPTRCVEYSTSIILPRIPPHESLHLPTSIHLKITDDCLSPSAAPHMTLSLQMQACFEGFEDYAFPTYTHSPLTIQYPVRIRSVECASTMGRGSQSQIRVSIENMSTRPFGYDHGAEYAVHYQVRLGNDVHFFSEERAESHYISHLAPAGTIDHNSSSSLHQNQHVIILGYSLPFYESTSIFVDLYIRQKNVEQHVHSIKVVPLFREDLVPVSDVLFFTNRDFTAKTFAYFERIFQLLQLEVNYFDTDHNQGYTNTQQHHDIPDWVGKFAGKLILLPVTQKSHDHWLNTLDVRAIESHFEHSEESGVLIVGEDPPDRRQLFNYLQGEMVRKVKPQEFDAYYLLFSPSDKEMLQRMTEIELQEYEKSERREHFVVHSRFQPRQIRGGLVRWRYTFGKEATLHKLLLESHHRLLYAHSSHDDWQHNRKVDRWLMFQVLCGLSFERRLNLLDTDLLGSEEMSKKELHRMILASIYAELYRLLGQKRIQKHISTIDYLFGLHPKNKHVQMVCQSLYSALQAQRKWRGNPQESVYQKELSNLCSSTSVDSSKLSLGDMKPRYLLDLLEQQAKQEWQDRVRSDRKTKIIAAGATVLVGLIGWMLWRRK